MEHELIACFHRSQIGEHRVAFKELGNEDATRGVLPDNFGHTLMEVVFGIAAELVHVPRFAPIIEFFLSPGNKLADRFNHPVNKSQAQTLDEADSCHHQSDISCEVRINARSLHFYRYLASAEIAHMHLADRGGGKRLLFEGIKNFSWCLPGFLDEAPFNMCVSEGGAAIEQVEQRITVFERQNIRLEGEHLAKLDEGAAQVFKDAA